MPPDDARPARRGAYPVASSSLGPDSTARARRRLDRTHRSHGARALPRRLGRRPRGPAPARLRRLFRPRASRRVRPLLACAPERSARRSRRGGRPRRAGGLPRRLHARDGGRGRRRRGVRGARARSDPRPLRRRHPGPFPRRRGHRRGGALRRRLRREPAALLRRHGEQRTDLRRQALALRPPAGRRPRLQSLARRFLLRQPGAAPRRDPAAGGPRRRRPRRRDRTRPRRRTPRRHPRPPARSGPARLPRPALRPALARRRRARSAGQRPRRQRPRPGRPRHLRGRGAARLLLPLHRVDLLRPATALVLHLGWGLRPTPVAQARLRRSAVALGAPGADASRRDDRHVEREAAARAHRKAAERVLAVELRDHGDLHLPRRGRDETRDRRPEPVVGLGLSPIRKARGRSRRRASGTRCTASRGTRPHGSSGRMRWTSTDSTGRRCAAWPIRSDRSPSGSNSRRKTAPRTISGWACGRPSVGPIARGPRGSDPGRSRVRSSHCGASAVERML